MAIQYPVSGAIVYNQFAPTSVQAICDAIKTNLVACGWTSASLAQVSTLTLSSNPTNGQTTVIAGKTYRYVTTLAGCSANDILIGAANTDTAKNLNDAINGSPGSGTEWCASTVASTVVTSTVGGAVLTITANGSGFGANSNFTITGTGTVSTTVFRGYKMVMPPTPQFLKGCVLLEDINDANRAKIRVGTVDLSAVSSFAGNNGGSNPGTFGIQVNGARTLEFCGNAHQFIVFMLNDFDNTAECVFFMTVPFIRIHNTGIQITGATNASPIVITAVGHGRTSGDDIYIADVAGNTAANGFWSNITVVDADHISLPASTGSAAYTSGGVLASSMQIARCMMAMGNDNGGTRPTYRSRLEAGCNAWVLLNQWANASLGWNADFFGIILPCKPKGPGFNSGNQCSSWGNIPDLVEPRIYWAVASPSSVSFVIGQLWAAFAVGEPIPGDRLNTGFDGHNWINICNTDVDTRNSLWFAKT